MTTTTTRANTDSRFYLRFLLMGIAAYGFALYCLYDGIVAYPAQQVRARRFLELKELGREKEWPEVAEQEGWSTDEPGDPKTDWQITEQFIMAGMVGFLGSLLLLVVWRSRGRWVEASETGITSSWGQSLNFDDVLLVDKKKWRDKGIAKITYQPSGGRKRHFVLDDFKYEREAIGTILYELEGRIDLEKIVGAPPEPEPGAEQPEEDSADDDAERYDDNSADDVAEEPGEEESTRFPSA